MFHINDFTIRKIKNAIPRSRVVSFDIFDTLVYRPFVVPSDLFHYLEDRYNKTGFYEARIYAETKAINNLPEGAEDTTIEEIYSNIDSEYTDMIDRELAYEAQTIRPTSWAKNYCSFRLRKK